MILYSFDNCVVNRILGMHTCMSTLQARHLRLSTRGLNHLLNSGSCVLVNVLGAFYRASYLDAFLCPLRLTKLPRAAELQFSCGRLT